MSKTKEFFDNFAAKWDEVNRYDRSDADFRRLVAKLGLHEGSKVVDLGSGTGVLIPYLVEAVGNSGMVWAVDVSEKMLSHLSRKFPKKNIKTVPVAAEGLSSIGTGFDAVICFSTFPHIDDKPLAIKEISKVLKAGGRFLIAHFSSRKEINDFHADLPEPICHHVLPDKDKMEELLLNAGFKITSFTDEPLKYELLAVTTKSGTRDSGFGTRKPVNRDS
jgi:demethylmenaquinone methyltransferase/2-methoxy-6-polyprenyl-1,4-benzoquinol methylase